VHTKVCCQGNGRTQEEQSIEQIQDDHEQRVEREVRLECRRYEVDKRDHRKDRYEHGVVDDGRIARKCGGNHIAD
jgi:hypothetical protein